VEIIEDYNHQYEQDFTFANHSKFKKDIAARLAHKAPYTRIETTPEKQIDLLIVVDQMLTGFDSKWLNTLYIDKVLKYENIIQAFSRTNRLFNIHDKPFGTIRYYRLPHTMERNINDAVKLYSGDKPIGLFAQRLKSNLKQLNVLYDEIVDLFDNADVKHFEKLPEDLSVRGKFAKHFKEFNDYLAAAKIQGFEWSQSIYTFGKGKEKSEIKLHFDEKTYLILVLRYKELSKSCEGDGDSDGYLGDIPFEIDGYLTEIDTGVIDAEYMNTRFEKYLKTLEQKDANSQQVQSTLDELYKSFASLAREDQKYANIFLHDIQSGAARLNHKKTFREHITEYQSNAKHSEIDKLTLQFGLDQTKLKKLMNTGITKANINEYGRFNDLKNSVDKAKAKAYFEELEDITIPIFKVNMKVHKLLQNFIINGGLDLNDSH
jgi:type I restriction enzyme R subunit